MRQNNGQTNGRRRTYQNQYRAKKPTGKQPVNLKQSLDSNYQGLKIRGTLLQLHEKYTELSREATMSGDIILGQTYAQHAEHYHRTATNISQKQNINDGNKGARTFDRNHTKFIKENNNNNSNENEKRGTKTEYAGAGEQPAEITPSQKEASQKKIINNDTQIISDESPKPPVKKRRGRPPKQKIEISLEKEPQAQSISVQDKKRKIVERKVTKSKTIKPEESLILPPAIEG